MLGGRSGPRQYALGPLDREAHLLDQASNVTDAIINGKSALIGVGARTSLFVRFHQFPFFIAKPW